MKVWKKVISGMLVFTLIFSMAITASAASPFVDIDTSYWGYHDVVWAYENGVMNGVGNAQFSPDGKMTRAMFVTVLARMSGAPLDNAQRTSFSDVPVNDYYTGAVKWAYENGVVNGVSSTEFAPHNNVTREQLCTMILRYANYLGIELTQKNDRLVFTDEYKISSYAKEAVSKCQLAGLINGMGDGTFAPQGDTSRAQAAAILHRLTKNFIENVHKCAYIDYVCTGCGAVDKAHAYEYLKEWVKANGEVDGEHVGVWEYSDDYSTQYSIVYSATYDYVYASVLHVGDTPGDQSDDIYCLIDLSSDDKNYRYWCSYGQGSTTCEASGRIDASTFTDNTPLVCDDYYGRTDMRIWFMENARLVVYLDVAFLADYIEQCIPGITIEDLGFLVF